MPVERVAGGASAPQPASSSGGAKQPRKRAMTAARKEQNRVAQKSYRKRQREQRQTLRANVLQRDTTKLPALQPHREPRINTYPALGPSQSSIQPDSGFQVSSVITGQVNNHVDLQPIQPPETDSLCRELAVLSKSLVPPLPEPLNLDWDPTELPFGTDLAPTESGYNPSAQTRDDILSTGITSNTESSLLPSAHTTGSSSLPCVKRNNIRLVPTNVACAVLENALSLGYDLTKLVACSGEYISPFYQPNASPQNDPEALITCSLSMVNPDPSSRTIPAHLRPTLAQVLIPHDASLDLIPLPFLRERAIMLSATMPQTFNLWELKFDIYHRGGLVIWQRDRTGQGGKAESPYYQPWDMRSWEAAPWFLQKWCMVVGGKESAFWKQSVWWHGLRGGIVEGM